LGGGDKRIVVMHKAKSEKRKRSWGFTSLIGKTKTKIIKRSTHMKYLLQTSSFWAVMIFLFSGSFVISQELDTNELMQDPKKIISSFYSDLNSAKDRPAPQLDFVLIDGKTNLTLSYFKGKIVVLKFWSVYCGPCKIEMPKINELQTKYESDRVVVLYLSDDSIEVQEKFFAKNNTIGQKALIKSGSLVKPYQSPLVPRSFLIDRRGIIRDGWVGTLSLEKMHGKISVLLFED
jgi:thiol-disulfide isomerase/thioredoxin